MAKWIDGLIKVPHALVGAKHTMSTLAAPEHMPNRRLELHENFLGMKVQTRAQTLPQVNSSR